MLDRGTAEEEREMMRVEYSSNNSGGRWWLSDDDWEALEAGGWKVDWYKDDPNTLMVKDGRFLGSLARGASKECSSLQEAVADWENITGQRSTDAGCPCCGQPHSFTLYDEQGNWVDSGPSIEYSASW